MSAKSGLCGLCAFAVLLFATACGGKALPVSELPPGETHAPPVPGRPTAPGDGTAALPSDLPTAQQKLAQAIGLEPGYRVEPAVFAGAARDALRDEISGRGLDVVELPSGAGHDAGILATAGVDAAMLFIRSLNDGVSHSPDELSSPEDVELAVEVLAGALGRLVNSRGT